jgi:hypothetical protein
VSIQFLPRVSPGTPGSSEDAGLLCMPVQQSDPFRTALMQCAQHSFRRLPGTQDRYLAQGGPQPLVREVDRRRAH